MTKYAQSDPGTGRQHEPTDPWGVKEVGERATYPLAVNPTSFSMPWACGSYW